MATYFVRKNGSDSYTTTQAQNAATAWLSIDKSANEVAAGDTVVVGAGVYREQVTMDTNGTLANQITFIADVDGALGSGDPGLVIISAYNLEITAAQRTSCVNPNERDFITWRGFVFAGGTAATFYNNGTGNDNYEGCIWEDCVFIGGHEAYDGTISLNFSKSLTPTNDGATFRRCRFDGYGANLLWSENETAETNLKIVFESCTFSGAGSNSTLGAAIIFRKGTTSTYSSGGVKVTNCTFHASYYGVYVPHGASTTYPVEVENCLFRYVFYGVNKMTTNDGALTSAYNTFDSVTVPYTNVTAGTLDKDNTQDPGLFGGIGDYPLHRFWGWSPFRPWEPIRLQDDSYAHGVIGAANASAAPAFDLYNENRPMHGTIDDRGAVEGRARPEEETTTTADGSTAIRFDGKGFQDFLIPVNASSTTVTVKARFDSNYTGTLPQLLLMNAPGSGEGSPDTVTTAVNTWDTLSINFTPDEVGIARVRIRSNDTSATGKSFFDTFTVT